MVGLSRVGRPAIATYSQLQVLCLAEIDNHQTVAFAPRVDYPPA
jgi:hypothetical protein